MKLQDFITANLAKSAQSTVEFLDVTITSVFPVKPTSTNLERIGIQTNEAGTLYCLKSQIQNPIESYKGGVSATVTFTPNNYTDKNGVAQESMRITNVVLHVLTPEKQAEIHAARVYTATAVSL